MLVDQGALDDAVAALGKLDPAFVTAMLAQGSQPVLRRRTPGFEGLAWIVVSQQVSTASAAAIFARLKARFPDVEAEAIAAASDEDLKLCGLSGAKIRTLRALGAALSADALNFERLTGASAEAAHAELVAIKGIGPWTADVFLLFCLGHPDAWPAGDVALQEAARAALSLSERPDTKALAALGDRWRPWRGVAAYLLWSSYRAARMPLGA
jgi:DNA-3-methyladenine glycosylase II